MWSFSPAPVPFSNTRPPGWRRSCPHVSCMKTHPAAIDMFSGAENGPGHGRQQREEACLLLRCEVAPLFGSKSNNLNLRLGVPQGPVVGNCWLLHQTIWSELFVCMETQKKRKQSAMCQIRGCGLKVDAGGIAAGRPAALMSAVDFGSRSTV